MSNDPDLTALALAKTKPTMASFSRAQEFEADGIGVGIAARARFDPYGAARFLAAMERNAAMKAGKTSLDPRAQDFLSSHPATPERVQNAQASARQYTSPQSAERDRETYLAAIDNIVYGEDPSEGLRGRRFLHPKLGFTFQAPDTFTLDNTAQAVIGVREGGTQAMRFDVVRVPGEQSLADYLNSGWMEGVDKGSTEDLIINGRRRQPPRTAINGSSRSMRCATAATSTASSSPPSSATPRASAMRARPSTRSAA